MARGLTEGFVDGLAKIVQDMARLKLAPDADMGFLTNLEETIVTYIKSGTPNEGGLAPGQTGEPQPQGAAPGEPPMPVQGAPGGVPIEVMQAMSRGPTPQPDMSGAAAEIAAAMGQ